MKIFLGYASEHYETAREVYSYLIGVNDDVWFDKESLVGGDDWDRERAAAQQSADFVVHLVSAEILERPGVVNREIKQTLKLVEDQPIGAIYVVFLRLDDLRMPAELLRFQYIDYFKDSWRELITQAIAKRKAQLAGAVPSIAPEKTTVIEEVNATGAVAHPSRVESSVSTEFYDVSSDYIQYPFDGVYWDFVNARLASEALGGFVDAVADFNRIDNDDKARIKDFNTPYDWEFSMQEFFRHGEFISVRNSFYQFMGGAHPSHGIATMNFLGPEFGFSSIKDMLSHDDEKAFRLVEYCKKVLLAMFDGNGLDEFIVDTFEDRKNTWNLASQYNFDDRGLTINFSPYEVLPFVFGSHEVFVPWQFVTPLLDEKFLSSSKSCPLDLLAPSWLFYVAVLDPFTLLNAMKRMTDMGQNQLLESAKQKRRSLARPPLPIIPRKPPHILG
ncbi:TIR domain-containing protein [Breoghania sp. L-A4]|uniref:TIR domain-containing protein n=1 Tax=Breoghania sp. L-A4 TaxID=2304600 RepID=UPI000E35EBE7|nr:TIR domain-containing protein [Breoghania sp. L-A4]AXS39538.1 TIR domain-containing protein [Breoghania sp. L-A4]